MYFTHAASTPRTLAGSDLLQNNFQKSVLGHLINLINLIKVVLYANLPFFRTESATSGKVGLGEKNGLKILVPDGAQVGRSGVWTGNVIYTEVLDEREETARSRVRGVSR